MPNDNCPKCDNSGLIREKGKLNCLCCGYESHQPQVRKEHIDQIIQNITRDYIAGGAKHAGKKHGIGQATLYRLPTIQCIRLRKFINSIPKKYVIPVLSEYIERQGYIVIMPPRKTNV